jgi:ketosteroid isomerase-like protein
MTLLTGLRIAGVVVAVGLLSHGAADAARTGTGADEEAKIKQTLIDWYGAYSGTDEAHYRTFLAEEYVLLENGELMGLEDDVKMMRNRPSGYARKDAFDFQSVRLHGDLAYAVYFLESEIVDEKKIQRRKWLESAVLRHIDGRWRAALLHSTRISGSDTPRE